MIERIAQPGGGEKGDKTKRLKEWWRRRGGNGEGEEEEEEEEDRSSCCWVLEQASPCQIIWYLKLFDRCSESSAFCSTPPWQSYSLLPEEERGDQTTVRWQLGSETQPRPTHTPHKHIWLGACAHAHTHTHTHTHTVMRLSSHSTCARARTFHSCNHTSRCRSVCGNGLT